MKNFINTFKLLAMIAILSIGLVSCGGAKEGVLTKTYTISVPTLLEGIAWINHDNYGLELLSGNKYRLLFKSDIFGPEDMLVEGNRSLIYWGDYTSAPSSDGESSHLDITLGKPNRMYFEQHGKRWGRFSDILNGTLLIDTDNWTERMTQLYDPETLTKGAEDFLAQYAHPMTITIEDPTLVPEDTTLANRIVEVPEIQF